MNDLPIFLHFIFAFMSTIGFAVYMNCPKDQIIPCGITGTVGWIIYYFLNIQLESIIFANFIAALAVTVMSDKFARKLKKPAILFILPGIIPLVPGLGLYNTMLYLVQGDYTLAISKGMDTLLVSGAIALALLVNVSLVKTFRFFRRKK